MILRCNKLNPRRLAGKVFPILVWSRDYNLDVGLGDLIAGITVALTLIPQSIGYASLAGLEPQYGLYASFIGGFVYAVMGTCPQINIGPTALISLLTFTYINGTGPDFAVLLCFMSGLITLAAGLAQLGFLVDFVSVPVVSGFTSAAAITIASSQVKGLLGLNIKANTFVDTWKGVGEHIKETRLGDSLLSLGCCVALISMKALRLIKVNKTQDGNQKANVITKALWFASVSRNAVVVIIAAILAFMLHEDKNTPFKLTGEIIPGLPTPKLPPFSSTVGNATYSAAEMLSHLGTGVVVVPLVSIIANVAIAKAFSNGQTLDATQEIVALGACNVVGAFFSSFPINGSFTRSALSDASGVRTPAAGFYTGILVLLTLRFLTPYFYYIPKAAFASVITCAVLHMVDITIFRKLWRTNKLDIIPLLGTFIFCLALGIEIGLLCGVGVDVLLLLYYSSRPPLNIQYVNDGELPAHYSIQPVGGLHFAGAQIIRKKLKTLYNSEQTKNLSIRLESLKIVTENEEPARSGNGAAKTNDVNNAIKSDINVKTKENTEYVQKRNVAERIQTSALTIKVVSSPQTLVVYCELLYRIDYTVLQNLKTLVEEWRGYIVWYGASESLKKQLVNVATRPTYCDTRAELTSVLNRDLSAATPDNLDTQL